MTQDYQTPTIGRKEGTVTPADYAAAVNEEIQALRADFTSLEGPGTFRYRTVALLLASTLTYSFYSTGDVIYADRHVYAVAASDASDEHLTTAGGVKLYVRPNEQGFIDVEALGIVPDGATNWEAEAIWAKIPALAVDPGLHFPPGYYAQSLNMSNAWSGGRLHSAQGAVFGGVLHVISSASPSITLLSSIARASNVVTVTTSTAHGFSVGDRIQVRYVEVTGTGSVGFETDDVTIDTVPTSTTLTYAQTGPDESGTVVSGSYISERPLKDLQMTGVWTTTDRLGTINNKGVYIEYCHVLSDPDRHFAQPGTSCRGAHLYNGTDNMRIGTLIIDDCVQSNSDAALALDGNSWNPSNINIDYCLIKDSGCHGAYITGWGHWFGKLEIRGFAREAFSRTLQDSNGATQSSRVKSIWINRCWDTTIETLLTDQIVSGSRATEQPHALIDETGLSTYGEQYNGVMIGKWIAKNVRRQGIRIGDVSGDGSTPRVNCHIGALEIHLSSEGLASGEYGLRVTGGTTDSEIYIGDLRLVDFTTNFGVYWDITATGFIDSIVATNHGERLMLQRGKLHCNRARIDYTGSSPSNPLWEMANPAVQGSYLGVLELDAGTITAQLFKANSASTGFFTVDKIISRGGRSASGLIELDSVTAVHLNGFDCVGPDSTSTFLRFTNNATDVVLGYGRVTGFALGLDKNSSTMTRVKGFGLACNGNTVGSNLTSSDIEDFGCTNVHT